jgi:hypothetical protein
MLHWTTDTDFGAGTAYFADYRSCRLRVIYMGPKTYTVFVERRGVLCTAHFKGRDALHRAKLAAPKLANVMIQHATTHHESSRKGG